MHAPHACHTRVTRLSHACHAVYKAMTELYDRAEADATIAIEWESDRRGKLDLDAALFMDGFFELADVWTSTVSGEAYAEFLWTLFRHVATGKPDQYRWKNDEDIEWGGCTHAAPPLCRPPAAATAHSADTRP